MRVPLCLPFLTAGLIVLFFAAFAVRQLVRRKESVCLSFTPAPLSSADIEYAKMMYEENADHARLHEELRGGATSLLVALIGALLAATIFEHDEGRRPIIGFMICGVSALGIVLNMKHYERYLLHRDMLRGFREQLEVAVTGPLKNLRDDLRNNHKHERWLFSGIRTHYLWNLTFVVTFLMGAYVSYAAHTAPPSKVEASAQAPA